MGDGLDCLSGMRSVEAGHARKIDANGGCCGKGRLVRPVEIGAARGRGDGGGGAQADTVGGRGGGAAAAPEARSAGQDRATCRGDRGGDPGRRYAPRRRLDAAAPVRRNCPAWRTGNLAAVALAPTSPKGFVWRRPRHTLKGRQDAAAVAASRERLADLKTQATAAAIDLVFLDESAALTHPYLARCWARRGTELRIEAPGQAKKRAMLGAFDPVRRRLLVHTSPTKRSTDFIYLLDQLGAAY